MARILIGNIKGPKGDTGPQGIQGEIGPQGPQGPLPPLVNNALTTTAGVAALDAAMGKTLQDQVTTTNSNLNALSNNLGGKKTISAATEVTFDTNGYGLVNFGYTFANTYTNVILSNNTRLYFQIEIYLSGFGVFAFDASGTKLINTKIWVTWIAHGAAK